MCSHLISFVHDPGVGTHNSGAATFLQSGATMQSDVDCQIGAMRRRTSVLVGRKHAYFHIEFAVFSTKDVV